MTYRRLTLPWEPAVALMVLIAAILAGCDGGTTITGVVLDRRGNPVADANVKLSGGGSTREITSSNHGVFKIGMVHSPWNPELSLTVAKSGFKSYEKRFHARDHLTSIVVTLEPISAVGETQNLASEVPPECLATKLEESTFPAGPFKFPPGETYKRSPIIKFEITDAGTVRDPEIIRSSGVNELDKAIVAAVSKWRYSPRPGCPAIETRMSFTIDFQ